MLKKGERVKLSDKSRTVYGVVSKGGSKRVTVILDGAKQQVTGNPRCFTLSDHPLPKDKPTVMDKYSIKGFKEVDGHGDSRTFSATICKNGKSILTANNSGWGGPDDFHGDRKALDEFLTDCKEWAKEFGCTNMIEPQDSWVEWCQFEKPYGKLAETIFNEYKELFK